MTGLLIRNREADGAHFAIAGLDGEAFQVFALNDGGQ